jgi:hypothetical protein
MRKSMSGSAISEQSFKDSCSGFGRRDECSHDRLIVSAIHVHVGNLMGTLRVIPVLGGGVRLRGGSATFPILQSSIVDCVIWLLVCH